MSDDTAIRVYLKMIQGHKYYCRCSMCESAWTILQAMTQYEWQEIQNASE